MFPPLFAFSETRQALTALRRRTIRSGSDLQHPRGGRMLPTLAYSYSSKEERASWRRSNSPSKQGTSCCSPVQLVTPTKFIQTLSTPRQRKSDRSLPHRRLRRRVRSLILTI